MTALHLVLLIIYDKHNPLKLLRLMGNQVDVYILSKYFGISYQALATHIYANLHFITYKHYQKLKSVKLPDIRFSICGTQTVNQVFYIGEWWDEKAIELEVGDLIVSKNKLSIDGPKLLDCVSNDEKYVYKSTSPGITRIYNSDWSSFTKVSRYKFQGFYQYKYEEEEEE